MKSVLGQLGRWRFLERLIRVAWGGARLVAIVATVLAVACVADWIIDRHSGSPAWRKFFRSLRVFAPSDPLSEGATPFGLRVAMSILQIAVAGLLGYFLLVRPWRRTPPVDDLAVQAEKAFPAFDHRLVTAIQLNRETAKTAGMSKSLIAEVTREAGEIASRHNLLKLVDYRRLLWALIAVAPVALAWGAFGTSRPTLATVLVKRQALKDAEFPRNVSLENATQDVMATGAPAKVRIKATFEEPDEEVMKQGGVVRIIVKGQPEDIYTLSYEGEAEPGSAYFALDLPTGWTQDFSFVARVGDGRTKTPGTVTFEAPPQLGPKMEGVEPLTADEILPVYLGKDPDGYRYVRKPAGANRGELGDVLPGSVVAVDAKFNKPVKTARLIPIERTGRTFRLFGIPIELGEPRLFGITLRANDIKLFGIIVKPAQARRITLASVWDGAKERDLYKLAPIETGDGTPDAFQSATWLFNASPRLIGYKIELEDGRGFTNPVSIRRNIRMWEDRPPVVEFKVESTRHPDPEDFYGKDNPKIYEWDMAVGPDGVAQVVFLARSDVGLRAANIRYRVIPKGVQFDQYPEDYKRIQHPRDDPNLIVYNRLPLTRFVGDPVKLNLGQFDADLGLFRNSFKDVTKIERNRVNTQFYPFPSRDPAKEPGELVAGGRYNFQVAGLQKKFPDGTTAKLEIGDTVEIYVEVYDKLPGPYGVPELTRPAGYTREAKRKTVLSDADTGAAIQARDDAQKRLQDKLRDLAADQANVFKAPKK